MAIDFTFTSDGWLKGAYRIPALNKSFGAVNKPKYVVLHGTSGFATARDVGYYFANGPMDAATHFIIDKNGEIVQCMPLNYAAWGNGFNDKHTPYFPSGNPNMWTVSIEHVKAIGNKDVLTSAQQDSSFKLVQAICNHTGIPKHLGDSTGGIIYHHTLDSVNKAFCPGPYPETELLKFLQTGDLKVISYTSPNVKNYYTEKAPGIWVCIQTGKEVHGGLLSYYMKVGGYDLCGLTDLGLPLTNEIDISKTVGTTKHYAVFQVYERGIVLWDEDGVIDRPVGNTGKAYKAHIDTNMNPKILELQNALAANADEIKAAKNAIDSYNALKTQLDAANSTIAQLEAQAMNSAGGKLDDAAKTLLNDVVSKADALVAQLRDFNSKVQ